MKAMKKLIALCLMASMAVALGGPGIIVAGNGDVDTSLERGSGGGQAPIVKVKWEMKQGTQGQDDSTKAGAQFNAPGVWESTMNYTVCAIVTDPNGASDIYGVYADIYYPDGKAIHAVDPDDDRTDQEYGVGGCGGFIEENTLIKLDKDEGYQLFCEDIRNGNNNLPVFNPNYNYDEICGAEGELQKETAYVYCDDKSLIWEDPAGNYKVKVNALDKSGNSSDVLENYFEYLPLTKFEVDFASVNYGQVLLNTHKKISGDRNFSVGDGKPTVRNLGNTRLMMKVAQDDMGLGKSSDKWNVRYDARVGNYEGDWRNYYPFKFKSDPGNPSSGQYKALQEILDLSETEEMDFSVLITKWPDANCNYTGAMWLSAKKEGFRQCGG